MTLRDAVQLLISETTRYLSPVPVAAEWVLVIIAALAVAIASSRRWGARRLLALRDGFRRLAGRKLLSIVICAVLPVVIRLAMLGFAPVPDPSIHDEFSHLLLADTLAHGRLTNPTHPMWMHFESIHIIQQPTYTSMYPPGLAVFLALGQVVFHEPWAGVVISVALMFAAVCWMMQAWLPPSWALFGTLVAILKFGIAGLWMNSYLTGAVAGIGGALMVGAAPRLRRDGSRALHALLAAAGAVILVNTRPFEGAVLSLAVIAYLARPLAWRFLFKDRQRLVRVVIVPAGLVLAAGAAFTAYYSWRVTGSPVRMPYQVNRDTYGWPENLAFLAPRKVTLRHPVLQAMYRKEINNRTAYTTPKRIIQSLNTRLFDNWTFFVGPVLTVPLLFLPRVLRDRRTRAPAVFFATIAALNLVQLVLYPYHLGPVVAIMFALIAQAIRHMYVTLSRRDRSRGLCFAAALPLCLIAVAAMKQEAMDLGIPLSYWEKVSEPHREPRADIERWLEARPRKQLVIVRYARRHSPNQEWVYNQADIDGSKVVWAREMDPASNSRLLDYFQDREAWLLRADVWPQHVVRYQPAIRSAAVECPDEDPGRECGPCTALTADR